MCKHLEISHWFQVKSAKLNYPERLHHLRPNCGLRLTLSFSLAYPPPPARRIKVLLLRTDKDPRTVPSASTAVSVPGANTAGRTAFPSHTSSHTATGHPGEKQNKRELGSRGTEAVGSGEVARIPGTRVFVGDPPAWWEGRQAAEGVLWLGSAHGEFPAAGREGGCKPCE